MRRFMVETDFPADNRIVVSGNLFRHMAKVLRLKKGTAVLLVDRQGTQRAGTISEVTKDSLTVSVEQITAITPPSNTGPRITLYQGLPKADKMEFILQKTTELGVSDIIPFVAARSVPRLSKDRERERIMRWQRIAMEAARQCERAVPPTISDIEGFPEIFSALPHDSVKLVLWEKEQTNTLKTALSQVCCPGRVLVLVGPEGGLTAEEARTAIEAGFTPITLGPRILRTETAAIAIVAMLQFLWGDMG